MPEITRNQTNTVHGLLHEAESLDLTVPAPPNKEDEHA